MYHLPHNHSFSQKYDAIPETFGMPKNHLGMNANLQFPAGANTFPPPFFHGPVSQGMFPGIAPGQVLPPSAFFNQNHHILSNNNDALFTKVLDDPLHPLYNQISNFSNQLLPSFSSSPSHQSFPQSPMNSFLQSFKNKDGSIDLNKMLGTAGQFMGVINQFSSLLKGFSQLFKS
jgi:hypothetical protein